MAHHVLHMPCDEQKICALRVGDTVTLEEILFGIRDATQIHMFDRGRRTKFDLHGHAVIHTAPNLRKVERSGTNHSGYEPVCIGTTTSDRMERFTRPLMERGLTGLALAEALQIERLAAIVAARREFREH